MNNVVQITGVTKRYRSPEGEIQTVVDIPEFQLEERRQLALCGASGTGKTTFLNLIAGILKPDEGEVKVAGKTMSALDEAGRDRLRAASIGYIFQTFNCRASPAWRTSCWAWPFPENPIWRRPGRCWKGSGFPGA